MTSLRVIVTCCILLSAVCGHVVTTPQAAQIRREYRALWVDTFNTPLNNHADILRVVRSAEAARLNMLVVQVRRRGDAWYLNSLEPPPDFVPIDAGFDPLADLIATAHASGIEVHAFVIAGAIWNKDPALAAPANGPPLDAAHAFNQHGGYDAARRVIVPGTNNWLTRTLIADGAASTYQGHRIGNDFWLDFGHPAAAAHTVAVLTHLVRHYDIDGLHLDRIRYPELGIGGQTPTTGASIGYNPVSVARFNRHHGLPADNIPPPGDARWADWRRAQVTNVVRRIYLSTTAIKPTLTVSAALIAFGGGPPTDASWQSSEAYWRVYQDWRAWMQEGILDLAMPMNYKREHDAAQARQFDEWSAWTKSRQYDRAALVGIGAFLNGVEGSLRQTRRVLAPAANGASAAGVIFYSLATSSVAVQNNPFASPPGQNTAQRGFSELAAGLTTSRSGDGRTAYEDAARGVFADAAMIPILHWKRAPRLGHLTGVATHGGAPLDTARVYLADRRGNVRPIETDGNGFFGAVDLDPDTYNVVVTAAGVMLRGTVVVTPGAVTSVVLRSAR